MRPTLCRISRGALINNAKRLKSMLGGGKLLVSVKANAYGHGALQASEAFIKGGADWLGLAMPDEGAYLRENGIKANMLVFGGVVTPEECETDVFYGIRQAVYDEDGLALLEEAAKKLGKTAYAHVKIDTGMNRIGVRWDRAAELFEKTKNYGHISVEGMFTHFADSDAPGTEFVYEQKRRFDEAVSAAKAAGLSLIKHAANSAGLMYFPEMHYDMARAGYAAYGYTARGDEGFIPAMTLVSRITHIHKIYPGDTVSYNRTYKADGERLIATIPIGYGDGYARNNGNRGFVLIGGRRAPIRGVVCMDQLMADITDIPGVNKGDETVLIGAQGDEYISAEEVGSWTGTIGYEAMTGLTGRVPRVYVD